MFGFQVQIFLLEYFRISLQQVIKAIFLQEDNVANQREHVILLLANVHIRHFPKVDQQPKVLKPLHSAVFEFLCTVLMLSCCILDIIVLASWMIKLYKK